MKKKFRTNSPGDSNNGAPSPDALPARTTMRRPPAMKTAVLLLVPVFLLATAHEASAQARGQRARGHDDGRRQDGARTLSDSVRRVERQTGGEVLSAERVPFEGRDLHRVKVVDASGRVRVYMDDPRERRAERPRPSSPPTRDRDD